MASMDMSKKRTGPSPEEVAAGRARELAAMAAKRKSNYSTPPKPMSGPTVGPMAPPKTKAPMPTAPMQRTPMPTAPMQRTPRPTEMSVASPRSTPVPQKGTPLPPKAYMAKGGMVDGCCTKGKTKGKMY